MLPSLVNTSNHSEMGFPEMIKPDNKLQTGVPLKAYFVRHDMLKAYAAGSNPKELLIDQQEFVYPVYYGGQLASAISVNFRDGEWFVKSIGDAHLINTLINARQAHVQKSNIAESEYKLVTIPSLYHTFLGHEQNENLFFTHVHDNEEKGFTVNDTVEASEVIAKIQPDALLDAFPLEEE